MDADVDRRQATVPRTWAPPPDNMCVIRRMRALVRSLTQRRLRPPGGRRTQCYSGGARAISARELLLFQAVACEMRARTHIFARKVVRRSALYLPCTWTAAALSACAKCFQLKIPVANGKPNTVPARPPLSSSSEPRNVLSRAARTRRLWFFGQNIA